MEQYSNSSVYNFKFNIFNKNQGIGWHGGGDRDNRRGQCGNQGCGNCFTTYASLATNNITTITRSCTSIKRIFLNYIVSLN